MLSEPGSSRDLALRYMIPALHGMAFGLVLFADLTNRNEKVVYLVEYGLTVSFVAVVVDIDRDSSIPQSRQAAIEI